ncbi:MAG: hypothetical protein PHS54_05315 [Clostridia bacterium]|nr:hypothetical protein [Clostridia bacterium]
MTRLRESNEVALFVSLGEVLNIKIENGILIIQTDKKYLADLINEEQNLLTIKRAMRYLGYSFDVRVEQVEGIGDKIEKDLEFLKQKFGNYLKIT